MSVTLYQPMTHKCVMSSHKPIRIYMGGLILGVNTLYRLFCFFKLFPMIDKGLNQFTTIVHVCTCFLILTWTVKIVKPQPLTSEPGYSIAIDLLRVKSK